MNKNIAKTYRNLKTENIKFYETKLTKIDKLENFKVL